MIPFRRKKTPHYEPDTQGLDEAHEALDHALDQWPAVQKTVTDMRRIRDENHLAEKIHRALGGTA